MKSGSMIPAAGLILAAMLLRSSAWSAEPAAQDRYPDPDWPETHDLNSVGTSQGKLDAYHAWLAQHGGDYWASVVIKQGYLIYSGRGPRCDVLQQHDCGSILKPLQGTVLGAALYQGKLKSIDENAFTYWKDPYLTPYENDRVITFRQFAQYHDRWNEPEPPGTFYYNNSSATAAGYCIAGLFVDVHGRRPEHGIAEVARREVMEKIGANWHLFHWDEDYPQRSDQDGPRMELDSSVYELAKLGYLWLRKGNWKTGRIFSEEFYHEAVTDWSPHTGDLRPKHLGHYGYWWFLNSQQVKLPQVPADAFYAYGNGEHRRATLLLVIPSLDTVAVLSMERLSDDGKWDVIQNAQTQTNEGPRAWSAQVVALGGSE